jgi:uncharacterized protein
MTPERRRPNPGVLALTLLALLLGTIALDNLIPAISLIRPIALPDTAQNFVTLFLGIFIEAAPFLLFGSVVSGLIAVFVSAEELTALFPKNRALSAMLGAMLGVIFPVCECGVVPVVRRLTQKGLPLSTGVAFLLAAPVLNPIAIASTYAAFGDTPVFWGRLIGTFVVAVGVGLVFATQPQLIRVMRPRVLSPLSGGLPGSVPPVGRESIPDRIQRALGIAADDFFDMGRFLVMGCLIAAGLQTFVPQTTLIALGAGQVTSVLALQLLAFVLSVCSTVDAFLALSFVNTFTAGSIISFLVFGPMIDIKSSLMFLNLFQRRVVIYLLLLPFLMTLVMGVFINLNLSF